MTWADLISLAYLDLNIFAGPDAIPAYAQVIGLNTLNGLIDWLGTQRLSMYTIQRQVWNLVANQQSYQLGPTAADWVGPRPTSIYRAGVILNAYSNPPLEKPVCIITDAQYAATRIKALPSTFPTEVYDDRAYPNANIWWYPLPQMAMPITLYVPLALGTITQAQITQTMSLPPGYQDMLEYNLVKRLGPKFSVAPNEYFMQMADSTLLAIKDVNQPDLLLRTPEEMRRGGRYGFNVYTGGFGRRGDN